MIDSATHRRSKRIKDLPITERPREKLLSKGTENLAPAELLAILLGTGTNKHSAISLAHVVLQKIPLERLCTISSEELERIPGVGKGKAARILAAFELGKRLFAPSSLMTVIMQSPQEVVNELRDIVNKKQEQMVVLYLNARYELIQREMIGLGSLNTMIIEPREIFVSALRLPCASLIISHNHPSGDPSPSEEDIRFTKRIQQAGELMGIPLLDHVIVSTADYFSFRGKNEPYDS